MRCSVVSGWFDINKQRKAGQKHREGLKLTSGLFSSTADDGRRGTLLCWCGFYGNQQSTVLNPLN